MKVLHIQKAKGVAGSERHLLDLLPRLRDRGVDVTMCILLERGGEAFDNELRALGIPTVELRAAHDFNPLLAPQIARVVRALQPDLVHTHLVHADTHGQLGAWLVRVRGVRSVHGTGSQLARQPYRSVMAAAGRAARRTIAISEHTRRFVVDAGLAPVDRVRVVLYGIDADRWIVDDALRSGARASFGIADHEIAIGVASRLIPHKGHDFLLAGFAAAHQELPSIRLLAAGDGELRTQLEAQARPQGGAVQFLGYLEPDRIKAFMNSCDVVAFPTLPEFGEGFGLAALEASAAGRPVVATDVASLPEIVDHEATGLLVTPGNISELSSALLRLARDPEQRARLGAAGHERARTRFAVDRMVDETIAVYEEALRS